MSFKIADCWSALRFRPWGLEGGAGWTSLAGADEQEAVGIGSSCDDSHVDNGATSGLSPITASMSLQQTHNQKLYQGCTQLYNCNYVLQVDAM